MRRAISLRCICSMLRTARVRLPRFEGRRLGRIQNNLHGPSVTVLGTSKFLRHSSTQDRPQVRAPLAERTIHSLDPHTSQGSFHASARFNEARVEYAPLSFLSLINNRL